MPELAEVETVKNTLKKRILNKKIKDVKIIYSKIIDGDIKEFQKRLINNQINDILRMGKWLIFELNNYYLLSHLRMEGKYFIKDSQEPLEKHEHIIISFDDHTDLRYHDTRKFGKMKLIKQEELQTVEEIQKLGREPIDGSLTKEYLFEKFHNKKLPLKTVLLDQEIISGLGNIYADEVAFAAGIHPLKKAGDLTIEECQKIVLVSKDILLKAIEQGGTTIKSYTSSLGVIGNYQNYLMVHKRENEPCKVCGTTIKRIKVGGRSTYYCEKCQKQ